MDIDQEAGLVLPQELKSRERLLWAGRPRRRIVFRPGDVFLIPLSISSDTSARLGRCLQRFSSPKLWYNETVLTVC